MDIRRENIYKQIGAKIAYYRKLTGITQEELASRVCLDRTVINRIENGKYNESLSLDTLLNIADAMEVKPTVFLKFNKFEKNLWDKYPHNQNQSVSCDEMPSDD